MYQAQRFVLDRQMGKMFQALGLKEHAVLHRARLPVDLFERKNLSLDAEEYFRLFEALHDLLEGDRPAPLLVADAIRFDSFTPPLMAAMCSPDFDTCIRRLQEFKPLIGPLVFSLETTDSEMSIEITSAVPGVELHPFVIAVEFVFLTGLVRHATENASIHPTRIESREHLSDEGYATYFRIRPRKGQKDCIAFAVRDTRLPFSTENESLWSYFEPELRRRLDELDVDATFAARVRASLMELLPQGKSAIEDVSALLGVSKRTLQRRLSEEDTRYQQVLNHSRELLARHYLTNSDYTSAEIAFLIGYDDPGSFSRAFHLWTGMTPEAVRKRAG